MGALPKRKLGRSRKGQRRSHHALKARNLVPCPNCHELRLPHQVCPWCGHYKGMEIVNIKSE
ncbi:MAG: 50S ribosomal protein L32 [Anaerolineae bacterium]